MRNNFQIQCVENNIYAPGQHTQSLYSIYQRRGNVHITQKFGIYSLRQNLKNIKRNLNWSNFKIDYGAWTIGSITMSSENNIKVSAKNIIKKLLWGSVVNYSQFLIQVWLKLMDVS